MSSRMSSAVFALPSAISPAAEPICTGVLQRRQRALGCETLDGGDLRAIVHDGKRQARIDAPPLNEHGAGAALTLIAAFFRPSQLQMLAQQVKERRSRIENEGMTRPVGGQAQRNRLRRVQAAGRLSRGA